MKINFFMSLWAHLLDNDDNISQSQHNESQSCPPIQKLLLHIHCIYFWWKENITLLTWGKFYKQKKKNKNQVCTQRESPPKHDSPDCPVNDLCVLQTLSTAWQMSCNPGDVINNQEQMIHSDLASYLRFSLL